MAEQPLTGRSKLPSGGIGAAHYEFRKSGVEFDRLDRFEAAGGDVVADHVTGHVSPAEAGE